MYGICQSSVLFIPYSRIVRIYVRLRKTKIRHETPQNPSFHQKSKHITCHKHKPLHSKSHCGWITPTTWSTTMRLLPLTTMVALALATLPKASCFQPYARDVGSITSRRGMNPSRTVLSETVNVPDAPSSSISYSELASVRLTNSNGQIVTLGDAIGTTTGTSVVVFLRHLG